jgi:hypothetical protein
MAAVAFFLVVISTRPSIAQSMSLPGNFGVSSAGAATYKIPIVVPPGTSGMAPSLELNYSSGEANGLLGVGWSLGGLPVIGRCAQTFSQDGVRGAINFDVNDRFCMDGQRLVAIAGTYGADGTEYRTEIESFTRIISHGTAGNGPSWFEVRTKTGQILEFGHTTDSLVLAQGKQTARTWALNKTSDTKGNYYIVSYTNDTTNGQAYPIEIIYTGNAAAGLSPYNKIQFVYVARPDITPQYQAGSLIKTTVRLTNIKVYAGVSLVSDSQLAYQQSTSTQRSRITSITLCAGDGSCLPSTNFGWTDVASSSFGSPQLWVGYYGALSGWPNSNSLPRFVADVNGDGLQDIVGASSGGVLVSLNSGTGFGAPQLWTADYGSGSGWSDVNTLPRFLSDVNGDGLPDMVGFSNGGVLVSLNMGTSFGPAQLWIGYYGVGSGWADMNTLPRFLTDVNGDGLPDIVGFSNGGVLVSLNTGTSFAPAQLWIGYYGVGSGWADMNTLPRFLSDVNGDGLPDIVGFSGGGVLVSLNTGTSFAPAQLWIAYYGPASGWPDNNVVPRFVTDVNGDGLPDIVGFSGGGVQVSLNTGTSFAPAQLWIAYYGSASGWPDNNVVPRFLSDVNGDGLPDIVGFSGGGVQVSLNTGTSFAPAQLWIAYYGSVSGWSDNNTLPRFPLDVNGDGLPDIVGFSGGGIQVSLNTGAIIPDLLATIAGGVGSTTVVSYKPFTVSSVYTKDTDGRAPIVDLIAPNYVVSRVDTSNGVGGVYSTSYAYAGAKSDVSGRGFLGFRQMKVTDLQTGVVETANYLQSFPYIGMLASKTKTLSTLTLAQATSTYQFSNASNAAAVSAPSGTSAPYRVSVAQSVSGGNDLDGTALPSTTGTFLYDSYGNATQVVATNSDGHSKTTANTYTNNATNWLLGRLTGSTMTGQAP